MRLFGGTIGLVMVLLAAAQAETIHDYLLDAGTGDAQ